MRKIYLPVYKHLWLDGGESYLNNLYSENNLKKELNDPNSRYYFVVHNDELVGILRVLLEEPISGLKCNFSTKLQRIYLDQAVQGKGIGEKIINWVEKEFCAKENSILWLEVMDTQEKALNFYKRMGFGLVDNFRFESDIMIENLKGMYRMAKNTK
ncbi:MAG: GNAT family N-acetyltransferase [Cellulophaga sp.]